ncbi:MAG: isochorismatase family cysteine hydrolase [Desulfosarcinaceae bacterium]|nr:isochorismatase family cysteine hydrolase [Desulfosarcinaceae bacterium]
MKTHVLIIVDMLNDFIDPNGALYCGDTAPRIVPYVKQRLESQRSNGQPVIFLQDAHDPDDAEFAKFPPHCIAGTWGSEIIADLSPHGGETIISKKRYSGFYGTDLEGQLQRIGATAAEVVGVCTSICVMDTVGGLANRDYPVVVPEAGVADFDPEMHHFALKRMAQLYGAQIR